MKSVLALAVSISLLICSVSSPVKAHDRDDQGQHDEFNNASLNDRYGSHVVGVRVDPSNPTTGAGFPFAIAGYIHFHGDGTFDGKDTISTIGPNNTPEINNRQYSGTYQVNPDGTGTTIINVGPPSPIPGKFVITEGGEQIEFISAVPGVMLAETLHKQHVREHR